uniref:Uncharacterized protein n=1 Tax=Oryza sativa subsp. japonica TaxID=39947 RepID=Q5Z5Q9_ORYSJ|nr:hypothetical protein [Oryza sativa Japonica Group]BAD62008.1 hypothetical protein [Oryza sativa Japonica Group]
MAVERTAAVERVSEEAAVEKEAAERAERAAARRAVERRVRSPVTALQIEPVTGEFA